MRIPRPPARFAVLLTWLVLALACEDTMVTPPDVVDPSQPAVVRLVPAVASATVGSLVSVEARIENGYDVGAVAFHLLYTTAKADFEPPATEGSFLSAGGAATNFVATEIPAGGEIIVQVSRTGSTAGANGSGLLATLEFRAVQSGVAVFTFSGASVKDHSGGNRPASFVGASLTVTP